MNAPTIGTLAEMGLHSDIKEYLAKPGDDIERSVDGYVADIYRNGLLIEVQTGNFGAMRGKLTNLLDSHPIHMVHPIAAEKTIVRLDIFGKELGRRRSPKAGRPIDIFPELVSVRDIIMHPNLTLEILMIREEEFWRDDGKGSWRRKRWSIHDRRLVEVLDSVILASQKDFRDLLPADLPMPFTNRELAEALGCSMRQAGAITYTMRYMGILRDVGKRGNAILYV